MDYISDIIIAIDEAGLRQDAYSTINTIFWYTSLLVGLLNGLKLKAGIVTTIVAVAAECYLSGPIVNAIIYVEDGFRNSGRANGVYIFAFIPLIGYLVAKILRKSYKVVWDILMVIPLTMFAGARIACTAMGCCRGFVSKWGVYNPLYGDIRFPVQLLETVISVIILIYVFWREKRNHFVSDGRNVPIILITYGIARFFSEFLHDDFKIFIFNWMQVHCFFMIIVGVITLRIIRRSEIRESQAV